MAKHIWLIYPCLKEFICASKIECNRMKKIRMKNPIKVNISLLKCWSFKDFKRFSRSNLYSLFNNLDLKCNTRCICNVNTFLAKEDPCQRAGRYIAILFNELLKLIISLHSFPQPTDIDLMTFWPHESMLMNIGNDVHPVVTIRCIYFNVNEITFINLIEFTFCGYIRVIGL